MSEIEYRQMRAEDRPEVTRLWAEETGWGALTEGQWQRYYSSNHAGPPIVVVAASAAGQLAGQLVLLASEVAVGGRRVPAFRSFGLIVGTPLRLLRDPKLGNHPLFRLYDTGRDLARERGAGLVYTVPDPKWLRLFRRWPNLPVWNFELWSLPLPWKEDFPAEDEWTSEPLDAASADVETVWRAAAERYQPLAVRDGRAMAWRIDGDRAMLVRQNGAAAGMVCIRRAEDGPAGERRAQYLVTDLLARDDEDALRGTLRVCCRVVSQLDEPLPARVSVLASKGIEPAVRELGFEPAHYPFPLIVTVLDSSIPSDAVAPGHWYLTPND